MKPVFALQQTGVALAVVLLLSLRLQPAHAAKAGELYYAEGLQLLQQGFYQEASQQLARSVALLAEPERCFALGVAYFKLHQLPKAYQAYQQALGLLPAPAVAARIRSGLGDVYFEMEAYTDALNAYRQALTFEPGWSGVRLKLATSYLRLERFGEALRESEALLKSQQPLSEAHYLRSLIYLGRHQWDQASQELQKLATQPEHRFEAYQQLNWLYRLQQKYPQAREIAERGVKEFGSSVPQAWQLAAATGLEQLTLCLPLAGCDAQPASIRSYLERWLLLNPEQPQVYFELGWFEQLQGNLEGARDAYARAYGLFPSHTDYLLKLAETQWALGDRAAARAVMMKQPLPAGPLLWRELPKWAGAEPELLQSWLAQTLPGVSWPQELKPFWLAYLGALPELSESSAEVQVIQALRLWQAGQPVWAKPLLLQAHRQEPQWWLPCELLGRLLLEIRAPQALDWLTAAYRLNPLSRELALLLAENLPEAQRRNHIAKALESFPDDRRLQSLYLKN